MLSAFPSPVLSVTADAVRDLEGRDALSGLWTLFSKCKESLQDGRRLENISWRLWYREMAASQSYRPLTPESVSPALSEESRNLSPFFLQHEHDHHPTAEQSSTKWASHPSPSTTSSHHDHLTTGLGLSFTHPKSNPSVGQIICYMLPRLIRLPTDKTTPSTTSLKGCLPTPTAETFHSLHGSSLPTPAADTDIVSSRTLEHPNIIPSVQLPSTPPEQASIFPRVVVVNPTPNLTPHPTPPASPICPTNMHPLQTHSSHLLPPPSAPALTLMPTVSATICPISPSSSSRPSQVQQLPRSPPSPPPKLIDEALKPSDRLFFLRQSPDGESPERSEGQKSASDKGSSVSSRTRGAVNVMPSIQPITTTAAPIRKGKESVRHGPVRHVRLHSTRPAVMRRAATTDGSKVKPTFNVGSTSSNGSGPKGDGSKHDGTKRSAVSAGPKITSKAPHTAKAPVTPKPLVPASPPQIGNPLQRRKIVVASTSSEYETTDTEDGDSWASEEFSVVDVEKAKEEVKLREAAVEAQRQREMFAKVPKRSYSNLNRSKSGLLSQLLNPDPTIFPSNHPYRNGFSSQDFSQLPRSVYAPRGLQTSKSAAALPLAARVTAQVPTAGQSSGSGSGGYRPKGRPQGQEMEEDSDSAEENPDDTIQVSRSVAQKKLAALAGRRNSDREASQQRPLLPAAAAAAAPVRPPLMSSATSPIPLRHPYNLPAPALPSTPRTTRRQMLQTELSESLRRNLLWERQVSKVNVRRHSGGINGLRPLTSTRSVVQVSVRKDADGKRDMTSKSGNEREQEGNERGPLTRNRSWADDYHYAGW